ncbi:acetate--CoA ligase family protein [Thermodesulfobacteriota bacterium]
MNIKDHMKYFMEPKSIAMIGVPRNTGRLSFNYLENLLEYGYSGKIFPVNPSAKEILGVKCYPTLKDIPYNIDLALIATPRDTVLGVVKECAEKRVKAVAIVTQGFSEFNKEGKALEEEMVRIIRESGGRLLGPNTIGVANAFRNVTTSFARPELKRLPIGVILQTGSFFPGTQKFLLAGKGIDLGNTSDIDFSDCLEYFGDDPETKVIALYVEGIDDGRKFMNVARRVSKKKPILALKTGRSESGLKATLSHTGHMASNDQVYDAVFKQSGIIRVQDFEEQNDLAQAFSCLQPMRGKGLGIVTMSGSGGVLAADACQDNGLQVADLRQDTRAKIQAMSLPWTTISNPVDIWPAVFSETNTDMSEKYIQVSETILKLVAKDPTVHGILFIAGIFNKKDEIDPTEIIFHYSNLFHKKPIVCVFLGRNPAIIDKVNETGKTVVLPSYERGVRVLGRLHQYAKNSKSLSR